jgi:hypothetical protein
VDDDVELHALRVLIDNRDAVEDHRAAGLVNYVGA